MPTRGRPLARRRNESPKTKWPFLPSFHPSFLPSFLVLLGLTTHFFPSFLVLLQDERGFNEFSFDELEKRLAAEEAAAEAGLDEDEDGEEGDMFG